MLAVFARIEPDAAQVHHFRQRYRLRSARLATNYARHDHFRLRCLCARNELGDENRYGDLMKDFPLGRAARPREIADMTVFLASDRSAYTSGVIVTIDGARRYPLDALKVFAEARSVLRDEHGLNSRAKCNRGYANRICPREAIDFQHISACTRARNH